MPAETQPTAEPRMVAWFVCRGKGITDDVILRFKAGIPMPSEEEAYEEGRMRAARKFKRLHGLHPCTRVEVELQGILPEGEV